MYTNVRVMQMMAKGDQKSSINERMKKYRATQKMKGKVTDLQ